ncbi:MAG: MBL fold metallo-hydrolase [Phycisphaerae bacterium]|jgi:glyoxylase-like metal-dependent hydrolase (beta-lactamase superfamily II)|nr:MBL fold metallo-hydrolase [Phycisphaerae bacterium]
MIKKDPPVALTDTLTMLGTNEYPIYLVNGGAEGAIFEGGVGAMGPILETQLAQLEITGDFVKQIFVTHAHPDHVMAVPALTKMFPEATVCASKPAAQVMQVDKAISFFCKADQMITDALQKAGSIGPDVAPQPLEEMRIPVDTYHADGDLVVIGDAEYDVLFTPGHSDCSLSFYNPAEKVLIISDATGYFVPDDFWWPNYFSHYGEYVDSINRLVSLETEVLCLSHNAAIVGAADVEAYFKGALEATEAYHARIIADVKAGKSVREIAGALGQEVFARTQLMPVEFFQKNASLLVKQSMEYEEIAPAE